MQPILMASEIPSTSSRRPSVDKRFMSANLHVHGTGRHHQKIHFDIYGLCDDSDDVLVISLDNIAVPFRIDSVCADFCYGELSR